MRTHEILKRLDLGTDLEIITADFDNHFQDLFKGCHNKNGELALRKYKLLHTRRRLELKEDEEEEG